ncbi:MAG: MerR family transcriptional regulator [Myxococcota bacterium]
MTDAGLSIAEAASRAKLSAHTLRYYERAGLIRDVPRDASGRRRYGEQDVAWVEFLRRLRATGMPIREMRRYAELVWEGDATYAERGALLVAHRERVRARLAELEDCLGVLDFKIDLYRKGSLK